MKFCGVCRIALKFFQLDETFSNAIFQKNLAQAKRVIVFGTSKGRAGVPRKFFRIYKNFERFMRTRFGTYGFKNVCPTL